MLGSGLAPWQFIDDGEIKDTVTIDDVLEGETTGDVLPEIVVDDGYILVGWQTSDGTIYTDSEFRNMTFTSDMTFTTVYAEVLVVDTYTK